MNKKIITFLGIIFILFYINKSYATEKIAFIDLNYVYTNSKVGKKIITETQKKQKNEFVKTLNSTLENYSKEHSISMILRKEQILIGKNSLDVTKDILDLFNKS